MDTPRPLRKLVKKLQAAGETPVLMYPAIVMSYATERMVAAARMGLSNRVFSWIVVTDRSIHFVRPGVVFDKVQSIPLDDVTDVEYQDEFVHNTLKIVVGEKSERLVFYDDAEGIKFYRYIKNRKVSGSKTPGAG